MLRQTGFRLQSKHSRVVSSASAAVRWLMLRSDTARAINSLNGGLFAKHYNSERSMCVFVTVFRGIFNACVSPGGVEPNTPIG